MISLKVLASVLLTVLIVAVALADGGPRTVSSPEWTNVVGAAPAALVAKCNGSHESYDKKCKNRGCGSPYETKKPVAKDGVLKYRWDHPNNMPCQRYDNCPEEWSYYKKPKTKCIEQYSDGK